jgi:CD109 antigen
MEIFYCCFRFYTVIAPKVVRPNSEYHVSVATHGVDRQTQIWVEVGGRQDSGGQFSASQSISVEPRTTRILRIDVSNYNFTLRTHEFGPKLTVQ